MDDFQRVLVAGTGPTTAQLAVLLGTGRGSAVGIAGRRSARSAAFFAGLERAGRTVRVDVQNEQHRAAAGEHPVAEVFQGYEAVTGRWGALVLAVTADAYTPVLDRIDPEVLRGLGCVVLVSPTFGSHALVRGRLRGLGADAEVISLSSYLGDTRWSDGAPSPHVLTAGVKKRLYLGSDRGGTPNLELLRELHRGLGVDPVAVSGPLEAETRNISLYVHPALFMNELTLNAVFFETTPVKYVYKLIPEGPVSPALVNDIVSQWREITAVVAELGVDGVNLLRFMVDDSYPVRPESISRRDVERFEELPPVHQDYLVYVRYASLLVDPFSEPDADGRYFDFSAIPIRRVFRDAEGRWEVPRMPKEDYYRTKVVQGVARSLGVPCPTIDGLLARYEDALTRAAGLRAGEPLTDAFTVRDFHEDLDVIRAELGRTR
ncbi:opine metallophore biosynthesis dehydrogenase [Actinosynnema pretiosum subsp. pretiosum]|uniref:Uncharacterized protein n=2 Tax=Actinosynnema TaxID=40566 RepID=C6WEI9_ACTMD|nr:opine metallophore biosynthesis dehydrogenase [Actinosynnema mirum]ACU37789.1 conserved hypothetical protein [Actinosynnema mirum DSM 43827]AXX31273.1 hypothetical protein APASM_3908 [Actinosynnema pretiosum subsp. pretiosum]QUF04665.1 opine metallophore biosynthesis dehydrogenase [Actinosynnema pretiosum subsp. pretiosum]